MQGAPSWFFCGPAPATCDPGLLHDKSRVAENLESCMAGYGRRPPQVPESVFCDNGVRSLGGIELPSTRHGIRAGRRLYVDRQDGIERRVQLRRNINTVVSDDAGTRPERCTEKANSANQEVNPHLAPYSPSTDHSRPFGSNSMATRFPGQATLFKPMQGTPDTTASIRAW
jgi:hypothetical protein